jgi:hypothetical protein
LTREPPQDLIIYLRLHQKPANEQAASVKVMHFAACTGYNNFIKITNTFCLIRHVYIERPDKVAWKTYEPSLIVFIDYIETLAM